MGDGFSNSDGAGALVQNRGFPRGLVAIILAVGLGILANEVVKSHRAYVDDCKPTQPVATYEVAGVNNYDLDYWSGYLVYTVSGMCSSKE